VRKVKATRRRSRRSTKGHASRVLRAVTWVHEPPEPEAEAQVRKSRRRKDSARRSPRRGAWRRPRGLDPAIPKGGHTWKTRWLARRSSFATASSERRTNREPPGGGQIEEGVGGGGRAGTGNIGEFTVWVGGRRSPRKVSSASEGSGHRPSRRRSSRDLIAITSAPAPPLSGAHESHRPPHDDRLRTQPV